MEKRNKILKDIEIENIADKGKGMGRSPNGKVVFVTKVAIGDVVDVLVTKKRRDYLEALPINFHNYSQNRTEPFCSHFGVCGGCQWQHVQYQTQLQYKQRVVEDAIRRIAKIEIGEFLPIVRADDTTYYRNKLEFTFSNKRWLTRKEIDSGVPFEQNVLGFHRPGAFDKIVNIEHCYLQPDPSNDLRNFILEEARRQKLSFWDARKHTGLLRHIMIRITTTGEVMLIISFSEDDPDKFKPLLNAIIKKFTQLTTLFYCINTKVNDYVGDLDMLKYYGPGFITEQLGHLSFKIGPKSFFQTNTLQAKVLYDIIVDFAGFNGEDNVYDLYTGLGSIAQYIAKYCKQVTGIEEIKEAIDDAWENAAINNIENCTFYAGDVKDILTPAFAEKHAKPDIVITDPPRAGMAKEVVTTLLQLEAPRIVYVSCNPATQARDLGILNEKYDVLKMQAVDMFPHTHHIESVALLQLKTENNENEKKG